MLKFSVICFSELETMFGVVGVNPAVTHDYGVSFRAPAVDGAQAENHFIVWLQRRTNKSQLIFYCR